MLGGGNAGLCAALSAAESGARVLLAERSPRWRRGGNSRHTRDIRYAHDHPDSWAPSPYSTETFLDDLAGVSELPRPDLAELVVRESRHLPDWMETHGIKWQEAIQGTLALRTNRFFLGGGKAMMNSYYRAAEARGITIRYDARAVGLNVTNAHCRSVMIDSEGKRETVDSPAVVVATGGLEANHAWLSEHWGAGAANFIVRGTPDNDGALLLALLELNAASAGTNLFHCIAVDARSPRHDGGIVTRVDSIPFGVVLNRDGVRFYDEGEGLWPKRYAEWGQLIAAQPDQIAFSIFDAKSRGLFIPPLYPPIRNDSLAGLCCELGLEDTPALQTIDVFNHAVDDSRPFDASKLDGRRATDLQPPRTNWARTIEDPPFFAYPLRPGLTFTYAGVAVDESARVLREDGTSFANVFAAGETMAGNILTHGYLAGVGLTIGSVFGRIAGREAARAR